MRNRRSREIRKICGRAHGSRDISRCEGLRSNTKARVPGAQSKRGDGARTVSTSPRGVSWRPAFPSLLAFHHVGTGRFRGQQWGSLPSARLQATHIPICARQLFRDCVFEILWFLTFDAARKVSAFAQHALPGCRRPGGSRRPAGQSGLRSCVSRSKVRANCRAANEVRNDMADLLSMIVELDSSGAKA